MNIVVEKFVVGVVEDASDQCKILYFGNLTVSYIAMEVAVIAQNVLLIALGFGWKCRYVVTSC